MISLSSASILPVAALLLGLELLVVDEDLLVVALLVAVVAFLAARFLGRNIFPGVIGLIWLWYRLAIWLYGYSPLRFKRAGYFCGLLRNIYS